MTHSFNHTGPQILISIYGTTRWGIDVSLGYSRVHVPVFGSGNCKSISQMLKAPILRPRCTNMMSDFIRWLTGRNPELKDPKILLDNMRTKGKSLQALQNSFLKNGKNKRVKKKDRDRIFRY